MIEVKQNLFIGPESELWTLRGKQWAVIHACKEPWHRAFVKYSTVGVPPGHPEAMYAVRENQLALNLVDGNDPLKINPLTITRAVEFIREHIPHRPVFMHCNQGKSRSPAIAFYYLHIEGILPQDFTAALAEFQKLYPPFAPNSGMFGFLKIHCQRIGLRSDGK